MSISISLDDVRKYILDSNSLEEAERLLLDNLLSNNDKNRHDVKQVNEAIGVKYDVVKDNWVDKLKISDLFEEKKKVKVVPSGASFNESVISGLDHSSLSTTQTSSLSSDTSSGVNNVIFEQKLKELNAKQLARSMSTQAYLLSAQRELDELKKNIEQRRSQSNLNIPNPTQKVTSISMDSKTDGDFLDRLSEIGKKKNLSSINDMLDSFIETGSVDLTRAESKEVIDQSENMSEISSNYSVNNDKIDLLQRNGAEIVNNHSSAESNRQSSNIDITSNLIRAQNNRLPQQSYGNDGNQQSPVYFNRRRYQNVPSAHFSIDDLRRHPPGSNMIADPYQALYHPPNVWHQPQFPSPSYDSFYPDPFHRRLNQPPPNPNPLADKLLSFVQQLTQESTIKSQEEKMPALPNPGLAKSQDPSAKRRDSTPSRGNEVDKPDFQLERDLQKKTNEVNKIEERKKSKAEITKENEIRGIQLELEKMKFIRELESAKADFEREKKIRIKSEEQEEWMEAQKHELQRLRMEQIIAREKKILNDEVGGSVPTLSADNQVSKSQDIEEKSSIKRQRELSGINFTIPPSFGEGEKKKGSGAVTLVDGAIIPMQFRKEYNAYRVAFGFFDKSGSSLIRLTASSWIPWTGASENLNISDLQCLEQLLIRRIEGRQMEKVLNASGARILVELQCKKSNDSQQSTIGWGVLPLTRKNDENRKDGNGNVFGNESSLSSSFVFGAWRIPLRSGLSDPLFDPLNEESHESKDYDSKPLKPMACILLRIIYTGALEQASSWSLSSSGIDTTNNLLSFYEQIEKVAVDRLTIETEKPSPVEIPIATSRSAQPATVLPRSSSSSKKGASGRFAPPEQLVRSSTQDPPTRTSTRESSRGASRGERNSTPQTKVLPLIDPKLNKVEENDENDGEDNNQKDSDTNQFWYLGNPLRPCTEKYQRGDGVDIYLDGARFLPDNCTVCRISLRLFNSEKQQIGSTFECYSLPSSSAISPIFKYKIEARQPSFNTTTFALMRIDTIDSSSLNPVSVGYVAFKLFCGRDRSRLSSGGDGAAFIHTGSFQLPIVFGRPQQKSGEFNESILEGLSRIPCASLLVRIMNAKKSSDGITTLTRDEIPEEKWSRLGLDIPAPNYSSGEYNGSVCEPGPEEMLSFQAKSAGPAAGTTVEAAITQALAAKPLQSLPSKPASSDQLIEWFGRLFPPNDKMRQLADFAVSVPYSVEAGLTVTVECLHNMPDSGPGVCSARGQSFTGIFAQKNENNAAYLYKAIVSIHPPGLFYKDPPLFDSVHYTKVNDLESLGKVPCFSGNSFEFHPPEMSSQYFLIVDIRMVTIESSPAGEANVNPSNKKAPAFRTEKRMTKPPAVISVESAASQKNYWTLLPLSREHVAGQGFKYCQTGIFQLPLIEGPVPYSEIFSSSNPYHEIRSRLTLKDKAANKGKASGFQLTEGCSVMVKVCNPLLSKTVNLTFNTSTDSSEAAVIETLFMDHLLSAAATTTTVTAGAAKAQGGVVGSITEKFRYYRSRSSGARTCAQNISAAIGDLSTSDLGEILREVNIAFEEDTKLYSS